MADESIPLTKQCSKCGSEHPATREFFPPVGKGLRPRCRPCWREHEREYFWANREKKREAKKRAWAKCDKEIQRQRIRAWREANPEKVRAIERRRSERIKASPEERAKVSARVRDWQRKNPEKTRERKTRFRALHPEATAIYSRRYRENNLDKVLQKERRWRENNRDKMLAQVERRRARMKSAEGEFTGHDVIALIKKTGRVCFYCGHKIKKYQIDHFIPLSRGGSNWPDNIVISCRACNLNKAAKLPWEWKPERFAPGCQARE